MTGFHYDVERRLDMPGVAIEIRNYITQYEVFSEARDSSYLCDLALTPRPVSEADRPDAHFHHYSRVGRFLLVPPRYPLAARTHSGTNRSLCCIIEEKKFSELGGITPGDIAVEALPADRLLDIRDTCLETNFRRILQELLQPGLASDVLVEGLVAVLIVDLTRHLFREIKPSHANEHRLDARRIERIREMIETHDGPGLSVAVLAEACNMSSRHLLRLFRNATGMSVAAYVAELRLERAMNLLAKTRLQTKEIAYRVGFSNASSFGEAFRRRTGVPPSHYRDCLRA
jgi:AraC family transcriptional regulator